MTDTTSKTTASAEAVATVAQVEHIDPSVIEFEANIRTDVQLDPAFVASIRAEGVLLPVLARRGDDGTVYVRDGQRRVLAAREAGTSTIPAYFGAGELTTAQRITQQLVTNDRRTDLTGTERVTAYEQLAFEGLSVAKIAKATGEDKATIEKSITVAKSTAAREALADTAVSLDRALLMAEFEADADALDALAEAREDELEHLAGELRHDAKVSAREEAVLGEYVGQGVAAVSTWPTGARRLHTLTDAADDADDRPGITDAQHAECPGRVVYVNVWGLDDGDQDTEEVCVQPELHHDRYRYSSGAQPKVKLADLPDDEAEARRAERRTLLANNKAWDAAEPVRREWIATLLTRKTLPKAAALFEAVTLTSYSYTVSNDRHTHTRAFLGLDPNGFGHDQIAKVATDTPTRAGHVVLATMLSARENHTSRESWRTPNAEDRDYLLQLQAWGYTLSAVERIAAGLNADDDQVESEDAAE
ncbi:ParB/RepB/Spo0J family partition protein [Schumannella soli]|uniref:ParB/RepB/Spo0J family partition protein n=1 Tax=Schumannella soli TaxID=2590779 RepID=UPI0015E831CA|nr:ParB/RepB/Spo0J family partition protein [Schumannella soli]